MGAACCDGCGEQLEEAAGRVGCCVVAVLGGGRLAERVPGSFPACVSLGLGDRPCLLVVVEEEAGRGGELSDDDGGAPVRPAPGSGSSEAITL